MPSLDKFTNKATVSVPSTALGTNLLTQAEYEQANLQGVTLLSDQDIALVDGTALGTYANSPFKIPAGVVTPIIHKAGPLKAIASSTTANVCVAPMYGHA